MDTTDTIARDTLLRAFNAVGYTGYTEAEVAGRLAVVRRAAPERVESYAFVVGRNWAVEQLRKRAAEARRRQAAAAELVRAARYRASVIDARREFWAILAELKPGFTPGQIAKCHVLFWRSLKGWTDDDVAQLHPRTNRVTRQQWVSRARRWIVPHATANLRQFICHYRPSQCQLHAEI